MCIAVIKPKNVDFPTKEQLKNCFDNNRNGAGFMYSDGENLIIKKGFMSFKSFMEAFEKENLSKDKLVFFHFRIATRGLVDSGNTHPFPIVNNVDLLRNTFNKFKGYGLMHNGVFQFPSANYEAYDKKSIISDTMLLSIKVSEELTSFHKRIFDLSSAIAYHIATNDKDIKKLIDNEIGYNKVAIMNEKEELFKYGNWIENNGVFYSNGDYHTTSYYHGGWVNYNNDYSTDNLCDCCKAFVSSNKIFEATFGMVCEDCITSMKLRKCSKCEIYVTNDEPLSLKDGLCEYCKDYDDDEDENTELCNVTSHCDICDHKDYIKNFVFTKSGYMLCNTCYAKKTTKNQKVCEMCNENYVNKQNETICNSCIEYLNHFNKMRG